MGIREERIGRHSWGRAIAPGLVLMVVGALGFGVISQDVIHQGALWRADHAILDAFENNGADWLTTALTVVTTISGPLVLPPLVAVGAVVWWRLSASWREPSLVIAAMALTTVVALGLQFAIGRPRPTPETEAFPGLTLLYSFPSGHTAAVTTIILASGYLFWRRRHHSLALWLWGVLTAVVVGVVGASRIYLGFHFLTDVLSGFCIGLLVAGVVVSVVRLHTFGQQAPRPSGP